MKARYSKSFRQFVEDCLSDVRYGLRQIRKNPGFSFVAIVTLALSIGANTAIFSIVDAVLLRPLPFQNSDRITLLTEFNNGKVEKTGFPFGDYREWRNQASTFEEIGGYWNVPGGNDWVLGGTASAERVRFSIVTNSFFSLLGVHPALGRGFLASEENPGARKVFLASDSLWRRVFGQDPNTIGKSFLLDGQDYTLIGVMPKGFEFPQGCDVWAPIGVLDDRSMQDHVSHQFWVLAKLAKDVTLADAQRQMNEIQSRLAQAYPATNADWKIRVKPLLDEFVGDVRLSLLVVLGAVGFILLIACTNVVNLMLVRASARDREFAVRSALGAKRSRLAIQSLTESLVIVCISITIAILLAKVGVTLFIASSSTQIPRLDSFRLNGTVLGFTIALAVVTTLLVGVTPALQISGKKTQEALRSGRIQNSNSSGSQRVRNILLVSEVALTLVLLCGAGLMLKSLLTLRRVNPAWNPENVLTMQIALPYAQYSRQEKQDSFVRQLLDGIKTLPGIQNAASTTTLPLTGESNWESINIVGRSSLPWAQAPVAELRVVTPEYFRTMEIPFLQGREFNERDAGAAARTAIINQAMASRFWPGENPIGKQFMTLDEQPGSREVVGVVGNIKHFGLDADDDPEFYFAGWPAANLIVRTSTNPASLVSAVRQQIDAADKGVPVYRVFTMDQLLAASMGPRTSNVYLLGLFAGLALILSAVGIYGLFAYNVDVRKHEIGIRMGLGAQPSDVLSLVLRHGMKLLLVGLGLGVLASFALTRIMSRLLYRVSPTDPMIFGFVVAALTLIAIVACYIPAHRAVRADPMTSLRHE
jgi:putative ABC transport system permease protein